LKLDEVENYACVSQKNEPCYFLRFIKLLWQFSSIKEPNTYTYIIRLKTVIYYITCSELTCMSILPRNAMRKRGFCCRPVSVCQSVRHVGVLYPHGWRYRQTSFSARYPHYSSFL